MTVDDKPGVDPILLKVLEAVPFRLAVEEGVDEARRRLAELPRMPVFEEVTAEDRTVEGPGGPLRVRIYRPPSAPSPAPVVVFFHGGGFALGDLDTHDGTARWHAARADAVVVSVDYRLAPEHPYPAAVEDALAATAWVAGHAAELGVDAGRLAVAGDSAGGTLAAVVAQQARAGRAPAPVFQLLWYPATMWDLTLPAMTENAQAPILDAAAIAVFAEWYLGEVDLDRLPAAVAPGRAEDLSGLAPAWIGVAGHDPLRDDGVRYAERLAAAGVPVQLDRADTLVHGYVAYAGVVPAATEATERGLRALRAALHG